MKVISLTEEQVEKLKNLTEYEQFGEFPVFGTHADQNCYGWDYYYYGKSCFEFPDCYNTGGGKVTFSPKNKRVVYLLERAGVI